MTAGTWSFEDYVGRQRTCEDLVTTAPFDRLLGTIRSPNAWDQIPSCFHWLLFLPADPSDMLGPDGHPLRGEFLPPIPLKRRMFGGARARYHRPLEAREELRRTETIAAIRVTGTPAKPRVIVTISLEVFDARGDVVLEEEQDLIFLDPGPMAENKQYRAMPTPPLSRSFVFDEVTLFRYSALTFNSHRIHFDQQYATDIEHYPGLVVQGPLVALMLMDLAVSDRAESMSGFRFRSRSPLFVGDEAALEGWPTERETALVARRPGGGVSVEATAVFGA